jgi:hypothetical protein
MAPAKMSGTRGYPVDADTRKQQDSSMLARNPYHAPGMTMHGMPGGHGGGGGIIILLLLSALAVYYFFLR